MRLRCRELLGWEQSGQAGGCVCVWGVPTVMVAAAGRLALLVTSFPQETRDRTPVLAEAWGLLPCGAGAQAPICRAGVFLLTVLKLWDLEHALGCRGEKAGRYGPTRETVAGGSGGAGAPVPSSTLEPRARPASPAPVCPLSPAGQAQPVHPEPPSPSGALVLRSPSPPPRLRPHARLTPSPIAIARPLTRACASL